MARPALPVAFIVKRRHEADRTGTLCCARFVAAELQNFAPDAADARLVAAAFGIRFQHHVGHDDRAGDRISLRQTSDMRTSGWRLMTASTSSG